MDMTCIFLEVCDAGVFAFGPYWPNTHVGYFPSVFGKCQEMCSVLDPMLSAVN